MGLEEDAPRAEDSCSPRLLCPVLGTSFLSMVFNLPLFFLRLFLNFLMIVLLEPQTPEWNPLIPKLRSTDLFFDYKEAKLTLHRITWGAIFMFYFFHFRY